MEIYLVWKDNGESYEDYYASVYACFKSYGSAVAYLEDDGWRASEKRKDRWVKEERLYDWPTECHAWIEAHQLRE